VYNRVPAFSYSKENGFGIYEKGQYGTRKLSKKEVEDYGLSVDPVTGFISYSFDEKQYV
jgi:hypothetical protein